MIEWSQLEDALKMTELVTEYIEMHRRENWFKEENGSLAFRIPETGAVLNRDQMSNISLLYAAMPTSLVALRRQVQENNPLSLVSASMHAWHHKASDARDKVYALLGIIDQDERGRYQVDYSIPVEQAYAVTMKTMLLHDSTMMVLSLAGTDHRSTTNLPSWCPDWRTLNRDLDNSELLDREWLFTVVADGSRQWTAGGTDKELLVYPKQDWRILRIKGTMIGVIGPSERWICSVGDHLKVIEADIADDSKKGLAFHRARLGLSEVNMDFEDLVDVVSLGTWACVLKDSNGNTLMGPKGNMQAWLESDPEHPDPTHGWKDSFSLVSAMMRMYKNKQTFMAGGGGRAFAGIGPASTQPGDAICLLHGLPIPVLLRIVEGEDPVIVGACYVRGVMEGQLINPDSGLSSGWYRLR